MGVVEAKAVRAAWLKSLSASAALEGCTVEHMTPALTPGVSLPMSAHRRYSPKPWCSCDWPMVTRT